MCACDTGTRVLRLSVNAAGQSAPHAHTCTTRVFETSGGSVDFEKDRESNVENKTNGREKMSVIV